MPKHIFTYGSLMFPEVWRRIVSGQYNHATGQLNGYKRFGIQQRDYPGLVPSAQEDSVQGKIYFNVSEQDQIRLDDFEGEEYSRQTTTLTTAENGEIEAEVYVIKPDFFHRLTDQPWNAEKFETECLQRFLAQYKGFIEKA